MDEKKRENTAPHQLLTKFKTGGLSHGDTLGRIVFT